MTEETLLCIANFGAGFGYAQHVFDVLYAGIADRLSVDGVRTLVGYPTMESPPAGLAGSAARAVTLDPGALATFARRENVRAVFFIDRPACDGLQYARLKWAGVRRVLVYNQTSGTGYRAHGVKRVMKWIVHRLPLMNADTLACASDFVAQREIARMCIPEGRIARVYNGVDLPTDGTDGPPIHERLGLPPERPIVLASCRAVPEKGVQYLFRAFDRVHQSYPKDRPAPLLVYVGSGVEFDDLGALRRALPSADSIVMTGYRTDAPALTASATVCVIPSVWDDAFPLAVLEPMARGRAVIATRVGGIPEAINSEDVGLLVPPRDEQALATAIRRLLDDPAQRDAMGRRARARIAASFQKEAQVDALTALLRPAFVTQGGA